MPSRSSRVPEEAVQTIDGKPCVFMPDEDDATNFVENRRHRRHADQGKNADPVRRENEGQSRRLRGVDLKAQLGKPAAD